MLAGSILKPLQRFRILAKTGVDTSYVTSKDFQVALPYYPLRNDVATGEQI